MATATLVVDHPVPGPSDADLFGITASLLDAMPGPTLGPRFSGLARFVCSVYCAGTSDPAVRADRLCRVLADYLITAGQAPSGMDVAAALCEPLFVSPLQPSNEPTCEEVQEAVQLAVRAYGHHGCAARVAQEFGDHPEIAPARMQWARRALARVGLDEWAFRTPLVAVRDAVTACARHIEAGGV